MHRENAGFLIAVNFEDIAEAERLVEINLQWQMRIAGSIDRMFLRTRFEPNERPVNYPSRSAC